MTGSRSFGLLLGGIAIPFSQSTNIWTGRKGE
jgi:hypothetical protein